ncbi:myosin light chain kinase, smooth muscle-like isoform X1 [Brienomyrus brachyistius]|uniref:myosin light chain kinase, smooth muscle-like isoform X1 n=2 Tax=Brienomyrus brachyistius TaxID=42636 RepID=UPI0020B39B13|nr:myosin light chain kinase, smooth muscle-like isoform X1 [Brienomyrus brachyistius]
MEPLSVETNMSSGCSLEKTYVSTFKIELKCSGRNKDDSPGEVLRNGSLSRTSVPEGRMEKMHEAVPLLSFEKTPQSVEVRIGEAVRLQCTFKSSFPVACCWMHNKHQVVSGPRIKMESSNQGSELVISEADLVDAGSYTIVVRNQRNSIQHRVSLSVVDHPQPPASSPLVSQLSSSSLVLSWSGPSYDGGAAVTGYVVEVRTESSEHPGDWTELTGCCTSTSYRVQTGLEPNRKYRFRVRAYNRAGVSEPSQESDTIKMDTTGEPQEKVQSHVDVAIDEKHKVSDHYTVMERLGVGKFGQVFRLIQKETAQVCAGKFYKARLKKDREAARKEIELMNYLHHPKLVQCLGAYESRSEMVMVMEFIAGGELFQRIVDDSFEHTESTCMQYMQQILEGVQHMHQQNIVHLDLKPENIVCVDSTGTSIKIIDFGLASKLDPKTPLKVMHGTPEFVAPEVISFDPVGLASDMWSIGVICYILLSGESPFQGENDAETLALVTGAKWEFDEESFEEITDQAKDFISKLLKKNKRQRMSCEQALDHPWMKDFSSAVPSTVKSLSKEKMKRFLAKQKWKKTGKALLALKRMALLSKSDGSDSPTSPERDLTRKQETHLALQALEEQLQQMPQFSQMLVDLTSAPCTDVCLSCHINGYPEPEVQWLLEGTPLTESPRVHMESRDDGSCTLVLCSLTLEDSGTYTCRATNSLGVATSSARLTVEK